MLDFAIYATTMIAVWSVLALSLSLQFGLTGLVNFGQVLPFALGAYSAGIAAFTGLPWWMGLLAAILVTPLVGVLVILPVGRLSQDYWALVTLGAGELFRLAMLNLPGIAGGADGVTAPRIPHPLLAMLLALLLLVLSLLVSARIDRSPLGRFLRVIREDRALAAALGRDPFRFEAGVTAVGWLMAGLAGVLYAHIVGYVAPSSFMVVETFAVWTAVVLGGPGSALGVLLGTTFVQLLSVSTRFIAAWASLPPDLLANLRQALFGLVLVLVLLFRPEGLIPERRVRVDAQRA
jgi:branched-chain amino acid transport system permease protein